MLDLRIGFRPGHSSVTNSPATRSSQEELLSFLSAPESAAVLSDSEQRELAALSRETDGELFHNGLLQVARRAENNDRIGLASQLYSQIQSRGEQAYLRDRAAERLALFHGAGNFGERFEFQSRRFFGQATDPVALASMAVGGAVFRVARLGILGRLAASPTAGFLTRGFGARALSGTGAFLAESTAFTLSGRGLNALSGRPTSPHSLAEEWAGGAITLAMLRGFGAAGGGLYRRFHGATASPWQTLYAQTFMFGGILTAHGLERSLGLREPAAGSNALTEGLVTLLQFNVAARLNRDLLGARWHAWETRVDRQIQGLSWNIPRTGGGISFGGLTPQLAGAGERSSGSASMLRNPGVLFMEGRSDGQPEGPRAAEPSNGAAEPKTSIPPESATTGSSEKVPSWWPSGPLGPEAVRTWIDTHPDTAVLFEFSPGEQGEGLLGRILMINQRVQEKFGYSPDEAVGLPLNMFTRAEDSALMTRMQRNILRAGSIKYREVPFIRKDGSTLYCDVSGNILRAGERTFGFAILQDVSNRRRAQEQIQAQQTRNEELLSEMMAEKVRKEAMLKGITDLMFRIDGEGRFIDHHAPHSEYFPVPPSQVVGMTIWDLPVPPELLQVARKTLEDALSTGETQKVTYPLPMPDGTNRYQEVRMTRSGPNEVVAIVRDITDSKEAETNRIAAARAEGIRLAGRGLAHDQNNALAPLFMVISHSRQTLAKAMREGRSLSADEINLMSEDLESADNAAQRIRDMTAGFRELGADPEVGPAFDLHSILQPAGLRAMLGDGVHLTTRFTSEPWLVPGPQKSIHRVVQNLVVNARDAMSGRPGFLRLETDRVVLGSEDLRRMAAPNTVNREVRNFTRLRVQDNGGGISPENLRRIFEPYFSTKTKNESTGHGGLGLAITQKLVQDAGGFLTVETTLGAGTTFDVYLPRADLPVSAEAQRLLLEVRGKSLLLVSQDLAFREDLERDLRTRGFTQILSAATVEQAQQIADGQSHLGAVLTDFRIGDQFGVKLLRSLRARQPILPAILWTELDPSMISTTVAPYGAALDRNVPANQLGATLEDLMLRSMKSQDPQE